MDGWLLVLLATGLICACAAGTAHAAQAPGEWRGVHVGCRTSDGAATLERLVVEHLAPMGVNVLVVEVNYGFAFTSRPELAEGTLDAEAARRLAETCRANGIRVIPLFNCLGHQSWEGTTFALLTKYPEFDETPEIPLTNEGIYCRSWCPLHPDVNGVVFDLMDELLDAFGADALHVGMDEVFLIGSDQCQRCRGKDPAELYAKAVNDYHGHLVGERGVEMLMWGDRLLDASAMPYGIWEASTNGTAPAIDLIPRDIIICDWHYEEMPEYPSVRYFQDKGFRVLPSPWSNVTAALALLGAAQTEPTDRMLGMLCTGWSVGDGGARLLDSLDRGSDDCREAPVVRAVLKRLAPDRPYWAQ